MIKIVYLSGVELGALIGIAIAVITVFFVAFFYLDKKIDDLKTDLNAYRTRLDKVENEMNYLDIVTKYIKQVGEEEAGKTFASLRGAKP
ncbi:MAG: hypothetical protein QW292_13885 [Candidatus Parvarchaeota archaeon]